MARVQKERLDRVSRGFESIMAELTGSADSVKGDAKLRGNSGDADATENHANGRRL